MVLIYHLRKFILSTEWIIDYTSTVALSMVPVKHCDISLHNHYDIGVMTSFTNQ